MKWLRFGVITVALLCLCGALSVSAVGNTAEYVFSFDGEAYQMVQTDGEPAFWEAPNVLTGQTRDGGVITVKNESDRTVDFTLESVSLPYDNEAALTYLDAVTLVIEQNGEEVYHAPFTRLMDGGCVPIVFSDVAPGESRELKLRVSCAFTYNSAVPSYESLVWTFRPSLEPTPTVPSNPFSDAKPTIDWVMVAKITGVLLGVLVITCVTVALVRWIQERRAK